MVRPHRADNAVETDAAPDQRPSEYKACHASLPADRRRRRPPGRLPRRRHRPHRHGAASTYALAQEAIAAGQSLAEAVRARGLGAEVDLAAALAEGRVLRADRPPRPGASAPDRHRPHPSRQRRHPRRHAQGAAAEETLTDSMKMFRMGLEGGKPARAPGVQPEWFYKGNGTQAVGPGRAARQPRLRARRRRGARDRRHLPDRPRRHAVPRRLRARQRVLRPCHRAAELSLPRPLQAPARVLRPGDPGRPAARDISKAPAASAAAARSLWEKPFLSGEANMSPHHRQPRAPPLQVRRCSASRATCMSTCSAPRRSPSPTASRTEAGDVFEIEAARLRPAAAQPADAGGG